MGKRPWGAALLVIGGAAMGIAVAGVPSRHRDPPLRVDASVTSSSTSTTSTTALPGPEPTTTTTVE